MLQVSQVLAEQISHFLRGAKTLSRLFRQQLEDDGIKPIRDVRVDFADRTRLVVGHAAKHGDSRLGSEWRPPGTHRVEHAAQTEQIAARINRVPLRLFR